jgi:hypothetical protein
MASQLAASQAQHVGAWQPSTARRATSAAKKLAATSRPSNHRRQSSSFTTRALAADDVADAVVGATSEASANIVESVSTSAAVGDAAAAVASATDAVRDALMSSDTFSDLDLTSVMAAVRGAAGDATATAGALAERVSSGELNDAAQASLAAAAAAADGVKASLASLPFNLPNLPSLPAGLPGVGVGVDGGVDVDPMMAWQVESSFQALATVHPALAGAVAAVATAGGSLAAARIMGVGGGSSGSKAAGSVNTGDLPTSYDIPAIKAYWWGCTS